MPVLVLVQLLYFDQEANSGLSLALQVFFLLIELKTLSSICAFSYINGTNALFHCNKISNLNFEDFSSSYNLNHSWYRRTAKELAR